MDCIMTKTFALFKIILIFLEDKFQKRLVIILSYTMLILLLQGGSLQQKKSLVIQMQKLI